MKSYIVDPANSAAALAALAAAVLPYSTDLERVAALAAAGPASYADRLAVLLMAQVLVRRALGGMRLSQTLSQGDKLALWGSLLDPTEVLGAGTFEAVSGPAVAVETYLGAAVAGFERIAAGGLGGLTV